MKEREKKYKIAWIFALAITLAALVCAGMLWIDRIASEKEYKSVQMMVNSEDIYAMANANALQVEDLTKQMADCGVSVVLFKEKSIEDLVRGGKAQWFLGANIRQAECYAKLSSEIEQNDANLYICFLDKAWAKQAADNILLKINGAKYYPGEVDCIVIPTMLPASALEMNSITTKIGEIGVGFPKWQIETMAAMDMDIALQVRSWEKASAQSLRYVTDEIKQTPNLYAILFNDKEVIGYPSELRTVADLLKVDGEPIAPLASIEFNEQKGFSALGVLMNKNIVRLHTIANNEMGDYLDIDAAMDRWMLAVRERNMRALFVRFFDIYTPGTSLSYNLDYLTQMKEQIQAAGFTVGGEYTKPQSVGTNQVLILLVGLGVASGLMMLLLSMDCFYLAILGFAATVLCWGGAFVLDPITARKLMALASVIIYPTFSCSMLITEKKHTILQAIGRIILISAVSFLGAIFMVGLLGDVAFMLKLEYFIGVKIAHIIPILAVPAILYIWNSGRPVKKLQDIITNTVTYQWAALAVIVGIAGIIYISRTGNGSAEISAAESSMRAWLNDVLGVRPRSKEFLIGYPFMLLLLVYGAKEKNWILTLPAVIGQVSLVNTYAHIHTPLLISLHRSVNGLIVGLLVGLILLAGLKIAEKVWVKYRNE